MYQYYSEIHYFNFEFEYYIFNAKLLLMSVFVIATFT